MCDAAQQGALRPRRFEQAAPPQDICAKVKGARHD